MYQQRLLLLIVLHEGALQECYIPFPRRQIQKELHFILLIDQKNSKGYNYAIPVMSFLLQNLSRDRTLICSKKDSLIRAFSYSGSSFVQSQEITLVKHFKEADLWSLVASSLSAFEAFHFYYCNYLRELSQDPTIQGIVLQQIGTAYISISSQDQYHSVSKMISQPNLKCKR